MSRRLPDDPVKRRLQLFKRLYLHLPHFHALMESGQMEMPGVITLDSGEDVYLADLMVGIDTLPRRQREAFELICLKGYTEEAAKQVMLPNSNSSTPVQQYSDSGLARMVARYDAKQLFSGTYFPTLRRLLMTAPLHPLVRRHLEEARTDVLTQMDGLKIALAQIDEVLKPVGKAAVAAKPEPKPEPIPKPEGKPKLEEAAKDLVAAGA